MLDALSQVAGWVKKNFWAKTDNIILRAGQFLRVGNSQLKDDKLGIGTLDVSGNATFSGRVGIGTAAPACLLGVNGTMSSTSSLGWTYSRSIPDNAATAIARVNFPSGTLLGAFFVTISVAATGIRAMRTFIVTMRYNGVDVTALNSPGFIGVSSLDLTASANATARTMTLSAKQVSGAAQTCHIHIQPLAIHYDDTVTFTGL